MKQEDVNDDVKIDGEQTQQEEEEVAAAEFDLNDIDFDGL